MENKKVEYFGINIYDSIKPLNVIRRNEFTNYLRNDFINGMEKSLAKMKEEFWPYLSCPMLFLRFDFLDFYTQKMEDNSIITNSSTLKALANCHLAVPASESENPRRSHPKSNITTTTKNIERSYIIFTTKKMINNVLKTFYILHVEPDPTLISTEKFKENLHIGKCLKATLKEKIDEYHIFGCYNKSINVGNSLVNFYYTHQIDLFDSKMNPIEVKAVSLHKYSKITLDQKLSENDNEINIDTVLGCKIGKIDKVIFGLHDKIQAEMYQKDLKELDVGYVAKEVKTRLGMMKKNLHDISQKYSFLNLKAARITFDLTNEWKFEEINLENLLLTYNGL